MAISKNVISIAFLASCCTALLLSIGGVITAFWALNVDQGWDSYETTGAGTAITFDGRLDEYSGWWFSPMPRIIHYGNERAVAGASVSILALSLLLVIMVGIRGTGAQSSGHRESKLFATSFVAYSLGCLIAAAIGLVYNQAANMSSRPRTTGYEASPPENLTEDQRTLGYNGTYNLRGWSCGVYDFAYSIGYSADALERTCSLATVARWIMIPIFLATLAMVVLAVVLTRRRVDHVDTVKLDDRSMNSATAK